MAVNLKGLEINKSQTEANKQQKLLQIKRKEMKKEYTVDEVKE